MKKEELNEKIIFIIINNIFILFIMSQVGTRAQVMHGNALRTGGGLTKKDLKYNKQGKIVSKTMSMRAKKEKRLEKAGWTVRKGQFGAFKMSGGGKFILGPYSKYNPNNEDFNIDKPVTPMPGEILEIFSNKHYNLTDYIESSVNYYSTKNPFHKEGLMKVNHTIIIDVLQTVYNKYMLGDMPDEEALKKMPSRQIIMYLGLTPDEFKNKILTEWNKLNGVLNRVDNYTNIATENNKDKIKGIKISGKNKNGKKIPPSIVREQTLWKLALNLGSSIEYEIQLWFGGKIIKRFRMNLENYRVKNKDREYIMSTITRHYLAENSNIRKNYMIQKLLNINTDDYIIQLKLTTRPRPKPTPTTSKAKTAKKPKTKAKTAKKTYANVLRS